MVNDNVLDLYKIDGSKAPQTLIPQRKGETLVPITGSWLMARISWFLRIPRISGVIAESFVHSMDIQTDVPVLRNFH